MAYSGLATRILTGIRRYEMTVCEKREKAKEHRNQQSNGEESNPEGQLEVEKNVVNPAGSVDALTAIANKANKFNIPKRCRILTNRLKLAISVLLPVCS
jgi:hypothetical protein